MKSTDLILLVPAHALLPYLLAAERGTLHHFADWVGEGLQDRGLVDDKDRLTTTGKEMLSRVRRSTLDSGHD